ncbi:MAG: nucleoside deaminase [Gordonia sp. (in: high G+C Gram-positive bacteria)]|uniref:nucleoside deaminase n=1 Tax=Gordonia sp. (in: high G+C Gram-positive bacteria) TaxID=84139 RepID=UPI0039E594AD
MSATDRVDRLLAVIADEIVPLTREGVAAGNKLFGAAILAKDDLSTVVAATNTETANPLWHGEITAINRFFELTDRPDPSDCLFLATHEPCSLCLSGITWSGFDEFAYLFSHSDSAESFAIPYDIAILKEVYAVPDPDRTAAAPDRDLYNRSNAYFTSTDLMPAARRTVPERVAELERVYADLSEVYQRGKGAGNIALA